MMPQRPAGSPARNSALSGGMSGVEDTAGADWDLPADGDLLDEAPQFRLLGLGAGMRPGGGSTVAGAHSRSVVGAVAGGVARQTKPPLGSNTPQARPVTLALAPADNGCAGAALPPPLLLPSDPGAPGATTAGMVPNEVLQVQPTAKGCGGATCPPRQRSPAPAAAMMAGGKAFREGPLLSPAQGAPAGQAASVGLGERSGVASLFASLPPPDLEVGTQQQPQPPDDDGADLPATLGTPAAAKTDAQQLAGPQRRTAGQEQAGLTGMPPPPPKRPRLLSHAHARAGAGADKGPAQPPNAVPAREPEAPITILCAAGQRVLMAPPQRPPPHCNVSGTLASGVSGQGGQAALQQKGAMQGFRADTVPAKSAIERAALRGPLAVPSLLQRIRQQQQQQQKQVGVARSGTPGLGSSDSGCVGAEGHQVAAAAGLVGMATEAMGGRGGMGSGSALRLSSSASSRNGGASGVGGNGGKRLLCLEDDADLDLADE
jgi:hypothetical protein